VALTLKEFLETLDDSISEEESLAKYRNYKAEFERRHREKFFQAHCGEEWFRELYYPAAAARARAEAGRAVQRRSRAFWEHRAGLEGLRLEEGREAELVGLLDSLVATLEAEEEAEKRTSKEVPIGARLEVEVHEEEVYEGKELLDSEGNMMDKPAGVEGSPVTVEESNVNPAVEVARPDAHLTASLFLRRVPPSVTRAEVVAVCGAPFPGFLRVGLAPARPQDGFHRKAWVTFTRDTKIKQICLALSGTVLGGVKLSPVFNKDLSRRLLPASELAGHAAVLSRDLRAAAGLAATLDSRLGVLPGVTGLLAAATRWLEDPEAVTLEELPKDDDNEVLVGVLDKVLFYLRVVHSVDWYRATHHPLEDRMPHRLGLLTIRTAASSPVSATADQLRSHLAATGAALETLGADRPLLGPEAVAALGARQEEPEVERFVGANVEQLGADRWLCTLSGKKFKAEEFARKHVVNKFGARVQKVRRQVRFFNAFLADPERPALPERPKGEKPKEEEVSRPLEARGEEAGRRAFGRPGGWAGQGAGPALPPRPIVDYSDMQDMLLLEPHIHVPCPW
jgi:hypothetical protein